MRLHLPFDIFGMREEVCVSSLVRVGNLGWTCGQCPLDQNAEVIAPHNLISQTSFVCEMIESVVQRGQFHPTMIAKLNVYFAETVRGDGTAAIGMIQERFPEAIVVPIPVPEFYYAGMMLEVDVFVAAGSRSRHQLSKAVNLNVVETDDLFSVHVQADCGSDKSLTKTMHEIATALHSKGLSFDNLLTDQWIASQTLADRTELLQAIEETALLTMADSMVLVDDGPEHLLSADLTFAKRGKVANHRAAHNDALEIVMRTDGHMHSIRGVQADPTGDLVSQTSSIMSRMAQELDAREMSFADVVKVTTHYVGGASEEDLHQNLAIRHRHYMKPGPASTGLRVASLLHPDCLIAIEITAIR
jgi:enamine deaminase RidA (YjgF/YER057c/UK114 family)